MTKQIIKDVLTTNPNSMLLAQDFNIASIGTIPAVMTAMLTSKSVTAGTDPVVTYHNFEIGVSDDIVVQLLLSAKGADVASVKAEIQGSNFGFGAAAEGWVVCSAEGSLSAVGSVAMAAGVSATVAHPRAFRFYRLKTTVTKAAGSTNVIATYFAVATAVRR